MIAVLTRGTSPKIMIRKSEGRKGEDSILKEKKFKYRAYARLFFYPNHMEVIKLQITKKSLGPCFGGTITLMRVVPNKDKDNRLILFSTKEKIMGLMSLPIDGNPYRYTGVITHPGDIKNIKSAQSVKFLFTTGRSDYTINIWKHNPNPSIDVVQSGGERIKPFLNLLEGRDGFKYKEMVDYSYYPQIKSKNENTTKQRI
jgi:hypothetical protein